MPYADKQTRVEASYESHKRNPHIKKGWAARNPEKRAAHVAVGNALRYGKLVKGPCEKESTGECRGRVQAHHDDCSKPLEVRWMCVGHHNEEHGR